MSLQNGHNPFLDNCYAYSFDICCEILKSYSVIQNLNLGTLGCGVWGVFLVLPTTVTLSCISRPAFSV